MVEVLQYALKTIKLQVIEMIDLDNR